ncbi:uncharacterized protein LOC143882100 [Tasmannia lanceolata]|uniref:uncharacterized protein LOC143882100 n=1 Tax=Tasmannia lanceolata TaxID=3420 RepID=UPI004064197D
MGKVEEEQSVAFHPIPEISEQNSQCRCRIRPFVGIRCVAALFFGVAVLLSAIFWLPPFLHYGADRRDLDQGEEFEAHILASFNVQKPVSLLNANMLNLETDIFDEIAVPNATVLVTSLEPLAGSNWTNVVFGVWPSAKHSTIPLTSLSILKATFVSLVTKQWILHLTPSLFGDPSFFQVLKFPGGITVVPQQNAFLLQKQFLFNFTLTASIYQIQRVFDEFKSQLKSYLRLNSYENLHVSLTNLQGSTLDPPIIVQSSIVLAVGNLPPLPRLKQLAQTITGSPAGNLGLNHTVFGKVRQIQLSSFMQHSLNSGTSGSTSLPPSPAPLPHPNHQPHHHRPHHDHYHHHDAQLVPAPAPEHSYQAPSPSGCRFRSPIKHKGGDYSAPSPAPITTLSPRSSAAHHLHAEAAPSSRSHSHSTPSPLPAVVFARVEPPSKNIAPVKPPDGMIPVSLSPSSSSVAGLPTVRWFQQLQWAFALLLSMLMHLVNITPIF